MKKFLKMLRVFFRRALLWLLIIASAAVIFNLFPHLGKFPYEYQQGSPWKHENLIPGFDFPILKTAQEVAREQDSILKGLKPYFVSDPVQGDKKKAELLQAFPGIWDKFVSDNSLAASLGAEQTEKLGEFYMNQAALHIDSLYAGGIMPPTVDGHPGLDVSNGIIVLKNKLAGEKLPGQTKTPLEAYQSLEFSLADTLKLFGFDVGLRGRLFRDMGFNRFIVSNLSYDHETTESVKESLLDDISLTRGLVQEGQRIISRGDMVTAERFLVLESFRAEYEKQLGDITAFPMLRIGHLLLILIILSALIIYINQFQPLILRDNLKMTFILILVVLSVLGGSLIGKYGSFTVYLIPFIIVPVILRAFFNSRTALYIHFITMLLVAFLVPNSFEFYLMQFMAGFAAVISFEHLHRRGQLVMTIIFVFAVYFLVYMGYSIIQEGSLRSVGWINLAWLAGNSLLILLSYPLIYIFEKLFGFVSDVTLIELSDSNHPLLRKMAEEAPGTFQHSIQVANLAESVVRVIGGNPLLVRTGAMYHDIGKMDNSIFFTENQVTGVNPHDQLERNKSAEIIISHVTRGVEIARKFKLPKPVIDFILTHHGTTRTIYFYKMFQNEHPGEEVDPVCFTYPGPKPFSLETAVLMMADGVEAASRSLKEYSEESIRELVENIIEGQFRDKQFHEAEITMASILKAKEIFISKLVNIYHPRVQYPK